MKGKRFMVVGAIFVVFTCEFYVIESPSLVSSVNIIQANRIIPVAALEIVETKGTFEDSRIACSSRGKQPVKINSQAKHDEVMTFILNQDPSQHVWTGMHLDLSQPKYTYIHLDNTTITFILWDNDHPKDQDNNHCLAKCKSHDGYKTESCDKDYYFLCEEFDRDGGWSIWTTWSCDVTCGTGINTRHRTCSNPSPSGNGASCSGSSTEYDVCDTVCPAQQQVVTSTSTVTQTITKSYTDTLTETVTESITETVTQPPKSVSVNQKTREELEEEIQKIKKQLEVDRRTLSSYLRKQTSAYDPRPSAAVFGGLGVVVISLLCGIIFILDLEHLYKEFKERMCGFRKSDILTKKNPKIEKKYKRFETSITS